MSTELQKLKTELDKWQSAVVHSRSTIKFLEERGDVKSQRIRELESQVKALGGHTMNRRKPTERDFKNFWVSV